MTPFAKSRLTETVAWLAPAAIALLLASVFLVGFRAWIDDELAGYAAVQWLTQPPHLGRTHWELRLPQVLSIAASFTLFGTGQWQIALPGVLAFSATCALVSGAMRTVLNPGAAFLAALLVAVSPVFFLTASYITPDMVELFFVALSLCAWLTATVRPRALVGLVVAAGLAAGLAVVTRLTSCSLLLYYGLAFVAFPGIPRRYYVLLGVGAALPILADWVFLLVETGDPIYRMKIALDQAHPHAEMHVFYPEPLARMADVWIGSSDPLGSTGLAPKSFWFPYVSLVLNHEFGLLMPFGLLALPLVALSSGLSPTAKQVLARVVGLGVLWFFVNIYLLGMRPHPRYFLPLALAAALCGGSGLWLLWRAGQRQLVTLALFGLLAVALVAGSLEQSRLDEELRLVELLKSLPADEQVHVFPSTQEKARFFLRSEGLSDRVSITRPEPGELAFVTPQDQYHFDPSVQPPESWEVLAPWQRQRTLLAGMPGIIALGAVLPPRMLDQLRYSSPGSGLYRIPAQGVTQEQWVALQQRFVSPLAKGND